MSANVRNKVVVITGAGGGIGRATALRFAANGAKVVATDLDEAAAHATADAIEAMGACGAAHAAGPNRHGARPGGFYVHLLGNTEATPPLALRDLMYHEGVPGHVKYLCGSAFAHSRSG